MKYLKARPFQMKSQIKTNTDAIPTTITLSQTLPMYAERVEMRNGKVANITTNPINIVIQTRIMIKTKPIIALI